MKRSYWVSDASHVKQDDPVLSYQPKKTMAAIPRKMAAKSMETTEKLRNDSLKTVDTSVTKGR